ncbi:MAG: hypothetical protein JOZ39_00815 [Chloroflexi bacterium]|nr:hypothetical protein [Chloroflexota bacterium]
MQQRYVAGDWKPAELDGGRLCEAVARGIYQLDTGTVTHSQLPGEILTKLTEADGVARPHRLDAKERNHIAKAIETVYKFRSDRGPVHISSKFSANGMDSMLVVHIGKWILAEFMRLAWIADRDVIGAVIEQIVQVETPLIEVLDGKPMVLPRGISAPEEVLLLLSNAPSNQYSRSDLRQFAGTQKPQTIASAISRLLREKEIRTLDGDVVALTANGRRRLVEVIIPKWATRPPGHV